MDILIRYHADIAPIQEIEKGDWVDLRVAETVELKKGEFRLISLGVSIKLPDGYEAHIVPRSSTYKNFGIIQTNHCGIVDNSYCGDDDIWMFPALATRDTIINKDDRVCQFRIIEKQPKLNFITVDRLYDESRGGFGSTGVN
ncbi:MAG: deoxyuridine 5'-triphosphate nucleotidohydrolase [Clostridiales bacterium]|jgi:dUTP pyrophosphatase|nr:deoxyuridine 5'-triphosphate nucleotidohydrolase [Clostridiales bacterium]